MLSVWFFTLIFRKSNYMRRRTIVQNKFWTNVCRLLHKRWEKGSASRLNDCLDWWCRTHFFCAYAKEVLLRVSDDFSFRCSLFLLAGSGKPCLTARFINETSRHPRQANRGRMILFVRPDRSGQTDNIILPCCRFTRFHASGIVPFSFCRFPFFCGFSFWSFLSNLPLLPFTSIFASFSRPHQAVIFVLGAKVTPGFDGKARSSLLFSGKISSPAGSIFP